MNGPHPEIRVAVLTAMPVTDSITTDRYNLKLVTTDELIVEFTLTTTAISLLQVTLGGVLEQVYARAQAEKAATDAEDSEG